MSCFPFLAGAFFLAVGVTFDGFFDVEALGADSLGCVLEADLVAALGFPEVSATGEISFLTASVLTGGFSSVSPIKQHGSL